LRDPGTVDERLLTFLPAAKVKDVKPGKLKGARLRGGVEVVVANVEGSYYAFEAYCPHQQWPLKWGAVDAQQRTLLCALHMWRFDLETGEVVDPPMADCLKRYPTRVEGDLILVGVDSF
jgi:nitrite reductase/ring-hydroxylating ferredoxin subunit